MANPYERKLKKSGNLELIYNKYHREYQVVIEKYHGSQFGQIIGQGSTKQRAINDAKKYLARLSKLRLTSFGEVTTKRQKKEIEKSSESIGLF